MPLDSFQPFAILRMPRSAVPDSDPYITATFIVVAGDVLLAAAMFYARIAREFSQ